MRRAQKPIGKNMNRKLYKLHFDQNSSIYRLLSIEYMK